MHQPNREIKIIFHLVGIISEAHYWEKRQGGCWYFHFYGWIKKPVQMRLSYRGRHGYQFRGRWAECISSRFSEDKIAGSQPLLHTGTTWGNFTKPWSVGLTHIHSNGIKLGHSNTQKRLRATGMQTSPTLGYIGPTWGQLKWGSWRLWLLPQDVWSWKECCFYPCNEKQSA